MDEQNDKPKQVKVEIAILQAAGSGFGVFNAEGAFVCGGTLGEIKDFIGKHLDKVFDPANSDTFTLPREDFVKLCDDSKELARLKRQLDPSTQKIAARFGPDDDENLYHAPEQKSGLWGKVVGIRGRQ